MADIIWPGLAALKRVVLDEGPLQGMKPVGSGGFQSRRGDDFGAVIRDRERETAVQATAVNQDGAGTALPVIAALFCPRKLQVLAERVE